MPCISTIPAGMTLVERQTQIEKALKRLEASLSSGKVQVRIGGNGAVAFAGWTDRDDVTDVCALRALTLQNSWALRQAIARAESAQGRKVNPNAVASGVHSHDGGRSWHPGHK